MSKLDPTKSAEIKSRAQYSGSLGVRRQNQMREHADNKGFVEPLFWTDIGAASSGAGGTLVGTPDHIVKKPQPLHGYGLPGIHLRRLSFARGGRLLWALRIAAPA
jgi:hypothetical protein